MKNLHPDFARNIEQSEKDGGINIKKFPAGTRIDVRTQNTRYILKILPRKNFLEVYDGEYFPAPTAVRFNGSTWGGSAIKLHWIGRDMCMEFFHDGHTVITNPVESFEFLPSVL